jgi:hypothetical protein
MPVAQADGFLRPDFRSTRAQTINQDKVVAQAVVLGKSKHHYLLP